MDFCHIGYGNPSGHSLRIFVFYIILFRTLITSLITNSTIIINKYIIYLGYFILLIILLIIGLSRIYFGLHHMN